MMQSFDNTFPLIAESAYVHSAAVVIGRVELGKGASVWPNAVLRGDIRKIIIGDKTNIQDGCVLHTGKYNLTVGENVMVGHNAVLHSCDISSRCLIGIGSIIMDGVKVGSGCIIGAGTVLPPSTVIPEGSVVIGNPYKITRQTTQEDIDYIIEHCAKYTKMADMYKRTARIL